MSLFYKKEKLSRPLKKSCHVSIKYDLLIYYGKSFFLKMKKVIF